MAHLAALQSLGLAVEVQMRVGIVQTLMRGLGIRSDQIFHGDLGREAFRRSQRQSGYRSHMIGKLAGGGSLDCPMA